MFSSYSALFIKNMGQCLQFSFDVHFNFYAPVKWTKILNSEQGVVDVCEVPYEEQAIKTNNSMLCLKKKVKEISGSACP